MTVNEFRIFGPPGTGKTTYTAKQVGAAVDKYGAENVIVASFTKAAAAELAGRSMPIDSEQIATLHAHCFRALSRPTLAETKMKEWNIAHPEYQLGDGADIDEPTIGDMRGGDADKYLASYNFYRNQMVPIEQIPDASVQYFARKWEEWKADTSYVDFTDLLTTAFRELDYAPGKPRVGFLDEAQDCTPLQLALWRKWARHMAWNIMAGDDDQASLEGTKVLTQFGYVPVEWLDVTRHTLASYDFRGCELRSALPFEIKSHYHHGEAVYVTAAGNRTGCTPEHKWWARWNNEARGKTVVYLMRKGQWWRVGWCQLLRADGIMHLGDRARKEGADEAWILKVCETRAEASMWESFIAARYGLPLVVWSPQHDQARGYNTPEVISGVYSRMEPFMTKRAWECLLDHGRLPCAPVWRWNDTNRGGAKRFKVLACNLLSAVMDVPVYGGGNKRDVAWHPIFVERGKYEGMVYSLAVEPHKNYVVDGGIVTGNCIYSFTGATPDAFLLPPVGEERKRVLRQSYRVPRLVQEVSDRWIKRVSLREPKDYNPRTEIGSVQRLFSAHCKNAEEVVRRAIEAEGTSMILAYCSYMLEDTLRLLKANGVTYHNPYRIKRGDWNPLRGAAKKLAAFLRPSEDGVFWNVDELQGWADVLEASVFKHGAKTQIAAMKGRAVLDIDNVIDFFREDHQFPVFNGDADWFAEHILSSKRKSFEYPLAILKKGGRSALVAKPKVIVGTIHSVKGGEADNVFVYPDLSYQGYLEYWTTPDPTIRTFYVAMTRARSNLTVAAPAGGYYVEGLLP